MRTGKLPILFLLAMSAAVSTAAQNSDGRSPHDCAGLRSLTGYDFSVTTAVHVPASGQVPEHCLVRGQIQPEVEFEVALPLSWNRRFLMSGNGGYAGESFDAPGRVGQRNRILQRGMAVASTNTGHDAAREPLGSFALNPQKLLDYAFRAVHVTAVTVKQIIQARYGVPPERSYFFGCSTGGRQALIQAQRFPQDFDGIVAGAPVLDFTGTMMHYLKFSQAMIASPIPSAKLKILADRIYAGCDGRDGLTDGLIDDPRNCDFDPSRDLPRCPGDQDGPDCFTAGQIASLKAVYGDVTAGGERIFPGLPVGAEVAGQGGRSGWDNWIVRDDDRTIGIAFAETFLRYLAFPQKDANYDWRRFDIAKDYPRMGWIRQVLDATDADLSAFKAGGGKLLMYFGWADPALNAMMGVEYYEKVVARMGPSTPDFFRLFMVPGMFHCGGGVGTGSTDWLAPLVDWVEKDTPPARIIGSRIVDGKAIRSRPICHYPNVARYKGNGSVDDDASFECGHPTRQGP